MFKRYLIILITVTALLADMGPILASDEPVVVQVPGNTVVQDYAGDLFLFNCIPGSPEIPCSLPPTPTIGYLPWTDIKTAKITQLGQGWVELSIALFEPVPENPTYWLSYTWQFEGGCPPGDEEPVTDKASISVYWYPPEEYWQGYWGVIKSCKPRILERGAPVDFRFSDETVRVRVKLEDLMLEGATEEGLIWYATVRRMPFLHPTFTATRPVDVAPWPPTIWEPR